MAVLIPIGGAVDCETPDVFLRVLHEARKSGSETGDLKVCIVTSATNKPAKARETYGQAFVRLGVKAPSILHITDKAGASDPTAVQAAQEANIIFFTGGDQLRLVERIQGTPFMQVVIERFNEINGNCVIAGTSAGAAAMSEMMIYPDDDGPALEDGFNFCAELIIDTHFIERGRLFRLFEVVAMHPGKMGLGLDEVTGATVKNGRIEAFGSGKATLTDGGRILAILSEGDTFNMATRKATYRPALPCMTGLVAGRCEP
ncbi:MAG TPA: cyanophycinase [Micavibrio sp.]